MCTAMSTAMRRRASSATRGTRRARSCAGCRAATRTTRGASPNGSVFDEFVRCVGARCRIVEDERGRSLKKRTLRISHWPLMERGVGPRQRDRFDRFLDIVFCQVPLRLERRRVDLEFVRRDHILRSGSGSVGVGCAVNDRCSGGERVVGGGCGRHLNEPRLHLFANGSLRPHGLGQRLTRWAWGVAWCKRTCADSPASIPGSAAARHPRKRCTRRAA